MRLGDSVAYAGRNLARSRLRTALTATGIAIGTAAVVTLVGFGQGIQAISVHQAASFGQLTTIMVLPSQGSAKPITPDAAAEIRRLPHVSSVDERLQGPPVRVDSGAASLTLVGEGNAPMASVLPLGSGTDSPADERDGVLLPASRAAVFGGPAAVLGRPVTVTAGGSVNLPGTAGASFVAGPDNSFAAHVAGFYDDSGLGRDAKGAEPIVLAMPLATKIDASLNGKTEPAYLSSAGYSSLTVNSDDARTTTSIVRQITAMGYRAVSRQDLLQRLNTLFLILQVGLGALGGIALLVAAIGIANTLVMTVLERTREIGVLKALGASQVSIRRLFLMETALIGVIGGVAGLLLSFAGGALGNVIMIRVVRTQNPSFDPGSSMFVVPIWLIAGGLALALAVSLLGGALPSRRAARLEPIEALRYE